MSALQDIIGDYDVFLAQLLAEVKGAGFDSTDFSQLDHMGYRTPSLKLYETKKNELMSAAYFLGETMVNERPISVFRLREPIMHDGWRVDAVELLAPKPGVETQEGLEHVEFVLYDDKEAFLRKYAGKQFDLKAADRGINPEIGYKLPHYGVKFHLLNLPTVVYLEKKLGLHDVRDSDT